MIPNPKHDNFSLVVLILGYLFRIDKPATEVEEKILFLIVNRANNFLASCK